MMSETSDKGWRIAHAQFLASRVYSLSETSEDAEGGERLMDFLWYEGSSCV